MNTTAALSFRAANNPYAYAPDKAYSATAASHVAAPSNAATDAAVNPMNRSWNHPRCPSPPPLAPPLRPSSP